MNIKSIFGNIGDVLTGIAGILTGLVSVSILSTVVFKRCSKVKYIAILETAGTQSLYFSLKAYGELRLKLSHSWNKGYFDLLLVCGRFIGKVYANYRA